MNTTLSRRDYLLARFKIENYLHKGFDRLTPEEEADLQTLSNNIRKYEAAQTPMPGRQNVVIGKQDMGDML